MKRHDENNKLELYSKILTILIILDHIIQSYFHLTKRPHNKDMNLLTFHFK